MVGGGIQEAPAVGMLQAAGYRVIVTDRNKDAPAFNEADIQLIVDATDVKTIIAWVLQNKQKYNISGMFTLTNQAATVSIVSNITGLPSLPADVAIASDNKLLMKKVFKEKNVPTADFIIAHSIGKVIKYYKANDNGKLYLKAADGFGGKGVRKIENIEQIQNTFDSIRELSNFPEVLVEKEVQGQFVDAQGIFHKDIFYPAGMDDAYFTTLKDEYTEYNPIETFNISPSQQPKAVIDEIYKLLEASSRALGINWGPVGGDFVITDDGIKVIEVGPRLHGPNGTLQIFPAATGINPLIFLAQCVTGDEIDTSLLKPKQDKVAACRVFISAKSEIKQVSFSSEPTEIPGIFNFYIYHSGKQNTMRSDSSISGLASVFYASETYANVLDIDIKVKKLIEIK